MACAFMVSNAHAHSNPAKSQRTVILISVDGLGRHLLSQSKTPHLDRIRREAASLSEMSTVIPAKTIPAHVSLLSGVSPQTHGLTKNERSDDLGVVQVPTLFDLLNSHGMRSAAVFGKEKLFRVFKNKPIEKSFVRDWPVFGDLFSRSPIWVTQTTSELIKQRRYELIFVHFALPDTLGHWFQWESKIQKWGVESVDAAIGSLFYAAQKHLEGGQYLIIITADHGGHGGSHGEINRETGEFEDELRDRFIPWIVFGAEAIDSKKASRLEQTSISVAEYLGLSPPPEWKWQGPSLIKIKRP